MFMCFFFLPLFSFVDLYVVEFQKRSLPHCHMLFWLHPEHKYHNSTEIDNFISAEIPDPTKDPLGYKIIT